MLPSDGASSQRPCSGVPSSAAKQLCESNRGRQSQSIEPSAPTNAAVWQSPIIPYCSSGNVMVAAPGCLGCFPPGPHHAIVVPQQKTGCRRCHVHWFKNARAVQVATSGNRDLRVGKLRMELFCARRCPIWLKIIRPKICSLRLQPNREQGLQFGFRASCPRRSLGDERSLAERFAVLQLLTQHLSAPYDWLDARASGIGSLRLRSVADVRQVS
jgi:hypothetical protein